MIEFYPQLRLAHVVAVLASGMLFLVRGLLVCAGRGGWALARPPRILSYAIDSALLAAALLLLVILPAAAYSGGWLAAKLAVLPVYVALGWFALRRRSASGRQLACFAGALLAYFAMLVIARTYDPLGPLRLLTGS
ncbi:MAG: hypothetical protein FJ171_02595 [Gammaproteobacteria bacterium]|nr:hypothetical protein [Gammaproteobacteria bacterium]